MTHSPRAAFVCLGLALGGCGGAPQTPIESAAQAIEQLREQTSCSRAVQGEAALSFRGEGRRLRGKVLYLAAAPESLRFDVLSSFGVTLSTLTSDGERFSLYNLDQRSFIYGPAETCNVQRFTQVPVPAGVLVELLRGRPPVLEHAPRDAEIRFKPHLLSTGHYEIEVRGEHQARETIELGLLGDDFAALPDQQRLRLLGVTVQQGGRTLYEVKLSDHRVAHRAPLEPSPEEAAMGVGSRVPSGPVCNAELPGRLEFYVPQTGYELIIDNQDLAHNPALSPMSFVQERPKGVTFQHSTCR